MVKRIHRETLQVGTELINKLNIGIFLIVFGVMAIITITASLVFRYDPAFHLTSDYPILYNIFLIFMVLLLLMFIAYVVYHGIEIFNKKS